MNQSLFSYSFENRHLKNRLLFTANETDAFSFEICARLIARDLYLPSALPCTALATSNDFILLQNFCQLPRAAGFPSAPQLQCGKRLRVTPPARTPPISAPAGAPALPRSPLAAETGPAPTSTSPRPAQSAYSACPCSTLHRDTPRWSRPGTCRRGRFLGPGWAELGSAPSRGRDSEHGTNLPKRSLRWVKSRWLP